MKVNQKGEGRAGAVFGFAILALVLYLGFKIIPVMIQVYAFEDGVKEECKFLHRRSNSMLVDDLVALAEEKNLPVTAEDIAISKVQVESHQNLKVTIDYAVPIKTIFTEYSWKQHIDYDAPVFD